MNYFDYSARLIIDSKKMVSLSGSVLEGSSTLRLSCRVLNWFSESDSVSHDACGTWSRPISRAF
jgi:uncharacterized protein (UPF0548 family)